LAHKLSDTLFKHFGFTEFKQSQEQIIESVLEGKNTLAILPTGGGKSLCYQIPTLHSNGKCLVISPLIALIKDQVLGLRKKNINALAIHSGMSKLEVEETYKKFDAADQHFLFISPERLKSELFLDYLSEWPITLIAVDEAHCISQWGYDFRPQYLQIAECKSYAPKASILALTASATAVVATDICTQLQMSDANIIRNSIVRNNLHISVQQVENKIDSIVQLLHLIKESTLIYCANRKTTVLISDTLQGQNITCMPYHADMEMNIRNKIQDDWINENVQIVACTQAFGMGIDKANVRYVLHYNFTETLEAYYQEIGRAGRDGAQSNAILYYRAAEISGIAEKVALRYPEPAIVFEIYDAICNYYRITYDQGANEWVDFDLLAISTAIDKNSILVYNALQILQQQDYILLSEGVFISSRILVTCSKADIDFLEKTNALLSNILKTILRLYSGVFRSHIAIQENKIAHLAEVEIQSIKPALLQLHNMGMVDFIASKDKPQLMLTQGRVRAYDYNPNMELVNFLRKRYAENLQAVQDYVTNTTECRMVFLARYFGESATTACKKCDVCLQAKAEPINSEIFNNLQQHIQKMIEQHNNISIKELYQHIEKSKHAHAEIVISSLIQQSKIIVSLTGTLKNNGGF
jgi:ATP-dependent DNA helicase RecQ